MKAWLLVPARGGSKGIPRKNLRLLAGKPLVLHLVERMSQAFGPAQVIVSTDDREIAHLCEALARVHDRSNQLADDKATLDDVAVAVGRWLLEQGADADDAFLTLQPTSPFLTVAAVEQSVRLLAEARSIVSVRDDRHLRWTRDEAGQARPLFEKRVNRQWLEPTLAETGGVIGCRIGDLLEHGSRIVEPTALLELDDHEGLDIDDYADWAVAEFIASRRRIMIRADGAPTLGMGHAYRALALAHELGDQHLMIAVRRDGDHRLGAEFLQRHPYPVTLLDGEEPFFDLLQRFEPDLTIVDLLDTSEAYARRVRQHTGRLVHLEDLGPGARLADVVINDLYTDLYPQANHWYGVSNAILAPHFETVRPRQLTPDDVEHVLVTFGGTDPANLTHKALAALAQIDFAGRVTVVLGPGYAHGEVDIAAYGLEGELLRSVPNMAIVMRDADLALTSAGRTVTELMCLGVPSIVLCQNVRELRHTHASSPFGVVNLGLGEHVSVEAVAEHLRLLVDDAELRRSMRYRAAQAVQGRSNRDVARRILQATLETDAKTPAEAADEASPAAGTHRPPPIAQEPP